MDVLFVASVAVIAPDPGTSQQLYVDALGLPLAGDDDYVHSESVEGTKHFGVWPLAQAAQACFGSPEWPGDRTVPQASVEFEVASPVAVQTAAEELRERGFDVLHDAREEPWGQTVARLQSGEGLVVGVSFAPWFHERDPCAAALGADPGGDDEQDADRPQHPRLLAEDDEAGGGPDGRLEAHQRPEGRGVQAPQRDHLQGEGDERHQHRQRGHAQDR